MDERIWLPLEPEAVRLLRVESDAVDGALARAVDDVVVVGEEDGADAGNEQSRVKKSSQDLKPWKGAVGSQTYVCSKFGSAALAAGPNHPLAESSSTVHEAEEVR